ncbi:internalin, putative [Indibacter alkaliphilus LW1]|uniref:Internalin, putative n=1 Tax=Indibacter alkaliphilus (strain CCUG 57479 / KCTC 22604 / LW1) TaxID=1189612 RepID=S2DDW3_INDAL|nr:PKD domain-containing protein [Indibacter alkaliphilus]EOZ95155.1 internalin, putative [Indibacter alkaliphilus LW1]
MRNFYSNYRWFGSRNAMDTKKNSCFGLPLNLWFKALVLVFAFISFFAFESNATHGRYGNISWRPIPDQPGLVEFKVSLVYRKTFFYGINDNVIGRTLSVSTFNHGDNTTRSIPLIITSESRTENWIYGEATFTKQYSNPNGNYVAFFQFCCRLSSLLNNRDATFRIESTVNLGSGNISPISTLQPVISLPQGLESANFLIPAFDPNGDNLTFSLTPSSQMGSGSSNPTGFSIDPVTGLASFNTNRAQGLYSVAVTISDNNGATIPVDFLILIIPASSNNPPVFIYPPTPTNASIIEVVKDEMVSFTIRGEDPDPNDFISLQATGVPLSANFVPNLPITGGIGEALETTFSWTPTELGNVLLNFSIIDSNGAQATTSVTILVVEFICDLSVSGESSPVTCVDGNNGTITIETSGGAKPYEFSIDGGINYQNDNIFNDLEEGIYTITVKDANGCIEETVVNVDQKNDIPVINSLTGPTDPIPASLVIAEFQAEVTDENLVQAVWSWGDGETSLEDNPENTLIASHTYLQPGNYTVTLTITDICGETASEIIENIEVIEVCDLLINGETFPVSCVGGNDGTVTVDVSGGAEPYEFSIDGGVTYQSENIFDNLEEGAYTIIVKDANNCTEEITIEVGQQNDLPVINSLTGSSEPISLSDATVEFEAEVSDDNLIMAVWNWGDGETSIENDPGNIINGSHTYQQPGVYPVTLTITDFCGETATELFEFVVVFDPSGGFVTGGGWIHSPAGAYVDNPIAEGRANFGFVSKYQRGAKVPTGQTQFQFQAEKFNFHSTLYEWLVVAGHRAQYKGEGRVNGQNGYGFMLTAIDGDRMGNKSADRFRIKIWEMGSGNIVYDNQMGESDDSDATTEIQGGSIVIHDAPRGNQNKRMDDEEEEEVEVFELMEQQSIFDEITNNGLKIYPNPASTTAHIQVSLTEPSDVGISIFDSAGRIIYAEENQEESSFTRSISLDGVSSGVYHVVVKINQQYVQGRLIKQ